MHDGLLVLQLQLGKQPVSRACICIQQVMQLRTQRTFLFTYVTARISPPFCLQSNLARSCSKLHEEYEVMLYGGMLEWLSTSTRSEFLKFSPPVVFEKVATSHLFFGTRDCLRDDPSSCFPPGHEFYEVCCHKCNHDFLVRLECPLLSNINKLPFEVFESESAWLTLVRQHLGSTCHDAL